MLILLLLMLHILMTFLIGGPANSDTLSLEPPCLEADNQRCRPIVTFITPTKGRSTLNRTLVSLLKQTNPRFKSIVMFDNVTIPALPRGVQQDDRFVLQGLEYKAGLGNNSAGVIRNLAMLQVGTPWVAFVDDDDTLAPEYVEWLIEEHKLDRTLDVVIFRMHQLNPEISDRVLPPNTDMTFHAGKVGISFAMRTTLFRDEGFRFTPHSGEDFILLNRLRRAGKRILIAPRIGYFVRHSPDQFPNMTRLEYRRVIIWPVPCDYTYVRSPACEADEMMCTCSADEIHTELPEMPLWAKLVLAFVIIVLIVLPFSVLGYVVWIGWQDEGRSSGIRTMM